MEREIDDADESERWKLGDTDNDENEDDESFPV
jgi:hypothetical protein